MKTFRNIFVLLIILCSFPLRGEQLKYIKGNTTFEVKETDKTYEVYCISESSVMTSRNRNITDRRLRMDAVDLIGAYILFKENADLPADLFQVYVEGIDLHYNAYVEGISQEDRNIGGLSAIVYICEKDKYRIESATYKKDIDVAILLSANYNRNKGEQSAALLYGYEGFTSTEYVRLEQDYLTGKSQIPKSIRLLQGIGDRFEKSVYNLPDATMNNAIREAQTEIPETSPYRQFHCEELITAAPISKKSTLYAKWKESIRGSNSVWEDFVLFCSEKVEKCPDGNEATISNVIAAFSGAISPFGMRPPIDGTSYYKASQAYSQSDFSSSIQILTESIDNEGITGQALNLLGASYRFENKPEYAMPYLLLCFKLDPRTQYLAGNIALCAKMLGYPKLRGLCDFLSEYASDNWSVSEIKNSLTNQ